MLTEVLKQAYTSLKRQPTRSFLTMLGIVWGIAAVALLIAYGSSLRSVVVASFNAFGKGAVICWPQQTSEQAGGERAGKHVIFEKVDVEDIQQEATLVKTVCMETVRWLPISYGDRMATTAIRGVCPEYGEMRNEVPSQGRWLSPEDELERRRVVFIGYRLREKLFAGRPVDWRDGAHQRRALYRHRHHGNQDSRQQLFQLRRRVRLDSLLHRRRPLGHALRLRAGLRAQAPQFEKASMAQVRAAIAKRQRFSPTDERAIQMFGREQFRPIIDGITIGFRGPVHFCRSVDAGHRRRGPDEYHAGGRR